MTTLKEVAVFISQAVCPEDIFGTDIKARFRELSKIVHPDVNADKKFSEEVFKELNAWLIVADERFLHGTYGKRIPRHKVEFDVKGHKYTAYPSSFKGDICEILQNDQFIFKIARNPSSNSSLLNEATKLTEIHKHNNLNKILQHVPKIIDTFEITQDRKILRVNVLEKKGGLTAKTISDKFGATKIDLRHICWMTNRLIAALACVHATGYVHGNVNPEHALLNASDHNGFLLDFTFAIKNGETLKSISPAWKSHYAPEVFKKSPLKYGADIYMLAQLFLYLYKEPVNSLPKRLAGLLRSVLIASRTNDIWEFQADFQDALNSIFGKPKFVELTIPK